MLSNFIHIRTKIDADIISIKPNEIIGRFLLENEDIDILKNLSSNGCIENLVLVDGKHITIENLKVGQTVEVKLYPYQLKDEAYYEDINELIKSSSQKYPTKHFYVFQSKFDSKSSSKPNEIVAYYHTTELISFLTSLSNYQKEGELVFFQAKHLILDLKYNFEDIGDLKSVPKLIDHISNSVDKEERQIIFLNELISTLNKVPEKSNRFTYLLKNFDDIFTNYKHSHTLYLEKYSIEKIKSKFNAEVLEYSKKIQSVINEAQSKLIAIPAAFLLIITQFDISNKNLQLNITLFLGSLVFSVLLELLIRNQFISLSFIKEDIERFKNSFSNELKNSTLSFKKSFENLDKAYKKQNLYLKIIRFLIWLIPLFVFILFIITIRESELIICIKELLTTKQ